MSRLIFCVALLAGSTASAAGQWMVVHDFQSDLAEDDKLTETIIKLTRGRVLATGVALVTDESVEESRTAMGMTELSLDKLPTLVAGVEAGHGLLVALTPVDKQIVIVIYRHDVDTEITAIVRKTVGKAALKRNLKKLIADLLKTPKARKKKKRPTEAPEPGPEFRKVGFTLANVDATTAKDLGLKKPAGVHVTALGDGVAGRSLLTDDVILKADRKKIKNPGELAGLLLQADLGSSFALEVWRDSAKTKVDLILGPEPVPTTEPEPEPEPPPEPTEVADAPPDPEEPPPPPRKLGVRVGVVTPELAASLGLMAPTGALVKSIKPNTVGERGKLKANDVILIINDKPVTHARNLSAMVQETHPRQRVRMEVWRERESVELQLVFEEAKAPAPPAP